MSESMNEMQTTDYPDIFNRYINETTPGPTTMPRRTERRFHGREVPLWFGYVHVDDGGGLRREPEAQVLSEEVAVGNGERWEGPHDR